MLSRLCREDAELVADLLKKAFELDCRGGDTLSSICSCPAPPYKDYSCLFCRARSLLDRNGVTIYNDNDFDFENIEKHIHENLL